MRGEAPPLSVVMSVFNGEQYLEEAIESILAQTFEEFEFIIVNDGSTDRSRDIIESYAARDARIRLVDQANTGLTVALVNGIAQSRGEFVARMDADDISLPARFEKQMALFDEDPQVVAVTCHVQHFSEDGSASLVATLNMNPRLVPLYNCFCNVIGGHGQVIFRRTAYDAAGGYDPDRRFAQDYDLWARLTKHGHFAEVAEPLYKFRTGHDSISKVSKKGQAESSLKTCQREFEKLTGKKFAAETALAMRYFWWNADPREIPIGQVPVLSKSMALAIETFFDRHPDLAGEERTVRRQIARMWWRRSKRLGLKEIARKAAFLAQAFPWALSALYAPRFADAATSTINQEKTA